MSRRVPPPEPAADPLTTLLAEIRTLRSRGEIKRMGERLDADPQLRALLEAHLGPDGGVELDPDAGSPGGKRLVRQVLDRADGAQVVKNPIHRDEAFECGHCGRAVARGGRMVRDHCPTCLRSLHVDNVPGDRAAGCGGLLDPIEIQLSGGQISLVLKCRRCGANRRVRAHPDDAVPPSLSVADLPGPAVPR